MTFYPCRHGVTRFCRICQTDNDFIDLIKKYIEMPSCDGNIKRKDLRLKIAKELGIKIKY